MAFEKGDWVAYRNGHGRRGCGYEGDGVVDYVQEQDGGDLLLLEDQDGMGTGIRVLASDCRPSDAPLIAARAKLAATIGRYQGPRPRGDKNAP